MSFQHTERVSLKVYRERRVRKCLTVPSPNKSSNRLCRFFNQINFTMSHQLKVPLVTVVGSQCHLVVVRSIQKAVAIRLAKVQHGVRSYLNPSAFII